MGKKDNRRTQKMKKRQSQAKLKARVARKQEAAKKSK